MRGILRILVAITLFSVMSALIKAARVPAGEAVFFRAGLSLPLIAAWLGAQGHLGDGLRTRNWRGHLWRGVAGSLAMFLGFAGLKMLPLPEVTAIRFATPLLIVVLAALLLGERFRLVRMSAVLVGLVGVLIILWPRLNLEGGRSEAIGALVVLASATCAAFAQIAVKSMSGRESTAAIVFYFSATATGLSLLTAPFGWVWPSGRDLGLLIGAGLVGGVGQIILTSSYRYADAGVLAPFTYVSMLWAILIGYFVFDEVPSGQMLAGAALIIAAGVAIALRERRLGLRTTVEGKVLGSGG